ncbi:MAG: porin, partial [Cytophagales bacterium]|nr:porin [Cytophagales bacterium]
LIGARYKADRLRANVLLHSGTYVQKNYAAEPDYAKYIFEANAGVRLAKNLWIDAGIFPSHIGLESATSLDNLVLTRSLCAENTPYYLSGAKVTWETENKKWLFSGLILNGWQTIQAFQRPQKAFGTQIHFRPSDHLLINSSNYIGPAPMAFVDANGQTNTLKGGDYLQRFLHNLYATWDFSDRLALAVSFDLGLQQKSTSDQAMNLWYNPTVWARFKLNTHFSVNGRLEHYNDKTGTIIPTGTPNNFQAFGYSIGLDYWPLDLVALRIEGRSLYTTDQIFVNQTNGSLSNNCTWFTTSIAAYLR